MTIEAQLDTIAQHLAEIKSLLAAHLSATTHTASPSFAAPKAPKAPGKSTPTEGTASPDTVAPAPSPEAEAAVVKDSPTASDYTNATLEDCKAIASELVKRGTSEGMVGRNKLIEIIKEMGVGKVTEIKPTQIPAFMMKAEAALAELGEG